MSLQTRELKEKMLDTFIKAPMSWLSSFFCFMFKEISGQKDTEKHIGKTEYFSTENMQQVLLFPRCSQSLRQISDIENLKTKYIFKKQKNKS